MVGVRQITFTRLFLRPTQVVQVHDLEKGNEKDAERSKEKAERVPFPECAGVEKVNNGDCEPESSLDTKVGNIKFTLSHLRERIENSFKFIIKFAGKSLCNNHLLQIAPTFIKG